MCRTQCVLALVALFLGLAHSWDLAVTAGDRLEFYTDRTKTDTVRFHSQNLKAITYDEVHNMLLYVDKQSDNDTICGYNICSVEYQCYIKRNGRNIQGLAFDPTTEVLFFTDTKERSINWISFKPGFENNANGNLLIKMADGIPTDIVVDICRGYIYWINTNLTTSTIERARLNGSEREVVITSIYKMDLHSLAMDQQTQKLYWFMPETNLIHHLYTADLSGKNKESPYYFSFQIGAKAFVTHPNTLTVSKESVFIAQWCSSCDSRYVWFSQTEKFQISNEGPVGIIAKYKISEQIQGIQDCTARTIDSLKIAREYVEPFCVHGTKVNGRSLCKCTPGYIGERCDISVCKNHCMQGDCKFNAEGLPKCRCNAGYSGERCEVNVCHGYCSNNGTCSLNKENEPVCQCVDDYVGDRCEVSDCVNYCLQGDCSYNEERLPKCRCNAGYSGERCEVNVCYGYCSNNGTCSLNEENEPTCECEDDYVGDRCEVSDCVNYCLQGDCSYNEERLPKCRCNAGYSGERCEVNVCYGYCSNNGTCSLNEENEPACECEDDYVGDRCKVSDCVNYCLQGDCSYNEERLPKCRCNAGYSGERCEVNVCLTNGDCSLSEKGSRYKNVKDNTLATNPTYYTAERNLTLADLLANWQKPGMKISVVVEVKPT